MSKDRNYSDVSDVISKTAVAVNEEVENLREKISDKERELASYRKDHGRISALTRELVEAAEALPPIKLAYRPSNAAKRVSSECAAVMRISDGHHGAIQPASEIEGFNEFSPEIGEARQMAYARKVIEWVEMHRSNYHIPSLHAIVTGDMISGDIHEELRVTNAWPAPVQAIRAGDMLARQIGTVAPHFERVIVEFIGDDNHGRLTKKPQAKEAGMNSFNYIVGAYAQALLAAHKNVTFNLYPVHEQVVHVLSRNYLCSHGHGVMGWAGVPWYGIERKVGKESQARLQVIMQDNARAKDVGFHKYVFGHFHTDIALDLYDGCASVSGTDAFDHKAGRYGRPGQASWLVHPAKGEFDRTNWWMD